MNTTAEKWDMKFGAGAYERAFSRSVAPSVTPQGAGDMLQDAVPSAQQLNDPMRFVRACQRLAERKRASALTPQGVVPVGTAHGTTGAQPVAASDSDRFIAAVKRRIAGRAKAGN